MSSKSLRSMRCRSNILKNSPLIRNKKSLSTSSCFEFDSEVLQNEISMRMTRESRRQNRSAKGDNFERSFSETGDELCKNGTKKVSKKKVRKIRNTMHDISNQCTIEDETNNKIKPNKIKKSHKSQVDDILEDKKNNTSSAENKENETNSESTDIEIEQKKTRKKKRKAKSNSENTGSQESDVNIPSTDERPKNKNRRRRKKILKGNQFKNTNLGIITTDIEDISNKCGPSESYNTSNNVKKNDTFEVIKTEITGMKRNTFEFKNNLNLDNNVDNENDASIPAFKPNNDRKSSLVLDNRTFQTISNLSDDVFLDDKLVNGVGEKRSISMSVIKSSKSKGSTLKSLKGSDDVFSSSESSLEISFKKYPRKSTILDHLNVTQFGERKNSSKKSSRGFSTGCDDEGNKMRFVTLKRGCRTFVDWSTESKEKRKHISTGSTSVILPSDFQATDIQKDEANKPETEQISTSVKVTDEVVAENTFDFMSNATKNMIDDMDSIVLVNSLVNDVSNMPSQIMREGTFTKKESVMDSPYLRKSTRKTWSQVEKTPVFNTTWCDESSQKREVATNKSKSVIIITPPKEFPKQSKFLEANVSKVSQRQPKLVRIESPMNTPKKKMYSPLVKKTPKSPLLTPNNRRSLSNNNLFSKSSPTSTSTPFPKKDTSLLKTVLTKDKNEKVSKKGEIKRVKMPNFEKIHQRRFEKMENLEELQKRKAKRARCLLSGHKPPAITQPLETTEKESRKKLQFSPLTEGLSNDSTLKEAPSKTISKTLQHVLRKSLEKENDQNNCSPRDLGSTKTVSKPLQNMIRKRASLEKAKKKDQRSKLPVRKDFKIEKVKSQQQPVKNITRFGFKLPETKTITKQEQINAFTSKTKVAKNRIEETRKEIQGVRSNRRFELLMKMRQKK
ncbi:uncharacterized protein LOC143190160 isoform X1 [Rhynchophorus ferrugineus]|uniref:uncharacterized protein LOC143190160 isoform X1 n=1 Tax=Rhynchophorus ferrugineus TaxID=354439 RepID=UPI003FCC7433